MSRHPSIKVLIANPTPVIRRGLSSIVAGNRAFTVSGETADSEKLKKLLAKGLPDVLLMDYNRSDFSSALLAQLRDDFPFLKILLISGERSVSDIKKAIGSGIKNYLLNDCNEEEISDAINACARGEKYFCRQIVDALLEREIASGGNCGGGPVSERELEVVRHLVAGRKPKEIAARMKLSYHTIIAHKRNVYSKLGINSAIELAQFAMRAGLMN